MSLMTRDTVSVTRPSEGATDDLGHPTITAASGFPLSVIGHFSHRGVSSKSGDAGLDQQIDAMFYAASWNVGELGDRVTFKSVEYIVLSVEPKYDISTALNHTRYALGRADVGGASHGL